MQLTYRGVAYPVTNTTVNTVDSQLEVTYRGQTYTRCRPISQSQHHQRNLTYRGVAYVAKSQKTNSVVSDQILALN